jgi:hypothetical protein
MNKLLQNKSVRIALGISILVLILVIILSPKKNVNPAGSPLENDSRATPDRRTHRPRKRQASTSCYLRV